MIAAAYAAVANFDRSFQNVLVHEGGYSNDAGDPGGPTMYGITIWDVRKYLNPRATARDVRTLTKEQAKVIYKRHYWDAVNADELPAGVDYATFDYAVNAGVGRALPTLRSCQAAFSKARDQVVCISQKRMAFQLGLPSRFAKFKRGWRNRILSVESIALNMTGVDKASLGGDMMLIPRTGPGKAYEEEMPMEGWN